jgi:RNA polymerase sigma-70 factor (ECF subfamily)
MSEKDLLQAAYRYALSLAHHGADAEDLVQDAWLRLHQKHRRVTRSLLFTTVRNLYIDQYRRNKLIIFEPFDEETTVTDADIIPDHTTMQDLEPALAQLRPEEREAIFLNSVEGYTIQEIADFTARPRGTVLSLVHRGRLSSSDQTHSGVYIRLWQEDERFFALASTE